MGVGAMKQDIKIMLLTSFAGLVAGACSMAIGEFIFIYSQYELEVAHLKRGLAEERQRKRKNISNVDLCQYPVLPILRSPTQAATESALAFSPREIVLLLAAAFVKEYKVRIGAIVADVN
ncbi:unnamed protein product [Arabidopsis lyrata]|uniref:Vacuolar iron transporter n=1 Tax=Arabidopsis lyrata subsp. lyrata TaxID=81972 RepID=D7LM80_ARALL|nr:predicted protein [Arabidopsis lyrata subsp. lyrata]CAH8267286.1 unnamed protein product [Arabidopsis lyrata]